MVRQIKIFWLDNKQKNKSQFYKKYDDKCFQYSAQLHKVIKIGADSKKKPTVETFINNDN